MNVNNTFLRSLSMNHLSLFNYYVCTLDQLKRVTIHNSNFVEISVIREAPQLVKDFSPMVNLFKLKNWNPTYGDLTGQSKKEAVVKFGAEQVQLWRRSYATAPPSIQSENPHFVEIQNNPKFSVIPAELLPRSESLEMTINRALPYWHDVIVPAMKNGKTLLIAAHGNLLRGFVKFLDKISDGTNKFEKFFSFSVF